LNFTCYGSKGQEIDTQATRFQSDSAGQWLVRERP
jgi:hypothetical protein